MEKKSSRNIPYPILLAVAVVIGIFIGMISASKNPNTGNSIARMGSKNYADNKLVYLLSMIDKMYVDSVDIDSLTERALPKLLADLDPHSVYIPAKDFAGQNEQLDGEFDGIGVVFNMSTDTVIILNVVRGGPSEKAGVQNGDRIIMIGADTVAGKKVPQDSIMLLLRGKKGTKIELSLQRQGIADLVPVTITRGKVLVKSLDAAFMLKPEVGYLKLSAFSKNSLLEVAKALEQLKVEGMKQLVFDLRGNNGGFLDQAVEIANQFLPQGKMIVYTEDRLKRQEEVFSNGAGAYKELPLIVLIDEGSASSSEILAGAIQDNDRGAIIGRRSYGKGLVQQQIPFRDNSAVRLTIARYYTPTGRSIQRSYADGKEAYSMDLLNRYEHDEFFNPDSIKFDDQRKYTTPAGRVVYGGGGIMPDIFVSLDTTKTTRYFTEVWGRNVLYKYTIEYSDRYRERLNGIETVDALNLFFDSDKELINDFVRFASRAGIAPNYGEIERSRELLTTQIRAYIGRNSPLEDVGFYSQIYKIDNTLQVALREFEAPTIYNNTTLKESDSDDQSR